MKEKIDIRRLARLITRIENRERPALAELEKCAGKSKVFGITGPPGAGKSTLVDGIIKILRNKGETVAVVAIDPSSPFSGGAILGDRIRMQQHAGDKGVFIRSVGSRGSHGGLSRATRDIVRAYTAYKFDNIIIETVGVGQTELDIMEVADVTVVVLVPESGDMVQTMKAGLLEIADIFVVNKADRPGAEQMKNWLMGMFDAGAGMDEEAILHHGEGSLKVVQKLFNSSSMPVLLTQAHKGIGVDELMKAVEGRLTAIEGDERRKKRKDEIRRREFLDMCAEEFKRKLIEKIDKDKKLKKMIIENLYSAVKVVDKIIKLGK